MLIGAFQVNFWLALLGGLGMILGAAYMLYLYRRVIFGRSPRDDLRAILDLSPREIAVFAPLIVLTLWMGIYPVQLHQLLGCDASARWCSSTRRRCTVPPCLRRCSHGDGCT